MDALHKPAGCHKIQAKRQRQKGGDALENNNNKQSTKKNINKQKKKRTSCKKVTVKVPSVRK